MAEYLSNPNAYNYAPSASPPSSPIPWDTQSLPPSDDDHDNTSPWKFASDPYSANAKATHSPLLHTRTKRRTYAPLTPSSSFASYGPSSPSPAPRSNISTPIRAQSKYAPIRDPTWEGVLNDVFRNGASIINLDNSNVTTIPREIIDLNNMVSLPSDLPASPQQPPPVQHVETPTRSNIASAAARSRRILSQSRSNNSLFSSGTPTKSKRELQIYLANNYITAIPSELFDLKNLTLLSLRGNKLRELPPAIGNLKSLRSLNVANNELTHLPAELSHLTLQTLLLDPNPFLPRPTPDSKLAQHTHSTIPKLAELALRVALHPAHQYPIITPLSFAKDLANKSNAASRSLLTPTDSRSSIFSIPSHPLPRAVSRPYDTRPFPPHTLAVSEFYDMSTWISENYSGSVHIAAAMQGTEDARNLYSWCPGPKHQQDEEAGDGLFIRPAEERLEWVTMLAGCELSSAVPILWRGCSPGCLDFLDSRSGGMERDEDEEFISAFGGGSLVVQDEVDVDEEAAVEAQTQIVWDDMMDLDS